MPNLLKQSKDLTISSFLLKPNGLEPVGSPSFEQWMKVGEFIRNANGAVHFWIGDWLNFGERTYGEMYSRAMDETGYEYQTLANDKWVASRIDLSRRRENLTFSHHAEVAELDAEEQEKLLSRAVEEKLDSKAFRRVTRAYKLRESYFGELTDEQYDSLAKVSEDFKKVEGVITACLNFLELLDSLPFNELSSDAKDCLLSVLRKVTAKVGKLVLEDEKNLPGKVAEKPQG